MRGCVATVRPAAWLLGLLLAACASASHGPAPAAEFVVVRHAGKADDGSGDPPLNPAGRARAAALAKALRDAPVRAVFATGYRRTQQTAAPVAAAHGVAVTTYDVNQPATAFAARLRRGHVAGTVLVIGHSNTVPALVAALCACAVAPLADDDYGRWYSVQVGADGRARLVQRTW